MIEEIQSFAQYIWGIQVRVMPVFFGWVIFETLRRSRRLFSISYVPVYFIFFPTGYADKLYAQLFGEEIIGLHGDLQEKRTDDERLKKNVKSATLIGITLSFVIIPISLGAVLSVVIEKHEIYIVISIIVLTQLAAIRKSLSELFKLSDIAKKKKAAFVTLYAIYLCGLAFNIFLAYEFMSDATGGSIVQFAEKVSLMAWEVYLFALQGIVVFVIYRWVEKEFLSND